MYPTKLVAWCNCPPHTHTSYATVQQLQCWHGRGGRLVLAMPCSSLKRAATTALLRGLGSCKHLHPAGSSCSEPMGCKCCLCGHRDGNFPKNSGKGLLPHRPHPHHALLHAASSAMARTRLQPRKSDKPGTAAGQAFPVPAGCSFRTVARAWLLRLYSELKSAVFSRADSQEGVRRSGA